MISKVIDICVYCGEKKEVTSHEGELVCYDCRVDFLDQEFGQDSESKEIPAELKYYIENGIPF